MFKFIKKVREQAKKNPKKIVLAEGLDDRVLKATEEILQEKIAKIILIGPEKTIKSRIKKMKLKMDWRNLEIIDPKNPKITKEYTKILYELRKGKGLTKKDAERLMKDVNYLGTMLVYMNKADGMVTGAQGTTADSVRPALQIIKTKEKFHKVSGIFFMVLEKRLLLFADAAITIDPNSHDLVDIAIDTAETAKRFSINPKIALLSFSTKGTFKHPSVDKIREAVEMIKYERPDLIVDGPLQVDAAIIPDIAVRKCPESILKGEANVLIFPNIEAANISYKLVERLARARAIGPLLQGLKKPVNDLSRGCNYKDIVNVTAFIACECEND